MWSIVCERQFHKHYCHQLESQFVRWLTTAPNCLTTEGVFLCLTFGLLVQPIPPDIGIISCASFVSTLLYIWVCYYRCNDLAKSNQLGRNVALQLALTNGDFKYQCLHTALILFYAFPTLYLSLLPCFFLTHSLSLSFFLSFSFSLSFSHSSCRLIQNWLFQNEATR